VQQPTVPTPYSDVIFPPIATLLGRSATTINFDFTYVFMPLNSLTIEDSYTLTGTPITIDRSLTVTKPFSAVPSATTAAIELAGLNLMPGVVISAQTGSTFQLGNPAAPTSLQLNLKGAIAKTGGGQVVVDTQSVSYPNSTTVQPIPLTIGAGSIALGVGVNLGGISAQINSTAALLVADNVAATVQSITGSGLVDLEGTTAANDQTGLTIAVPVGTTDRFDGFIEGVGRFTMGGNGTLSTGTIDFDGAGAIDVAYGTLDVDGSISAGALQVGPFGTLGGLGLWNFSGPAVFQSGATFDVTLKGTTPGTRFTQLVDTDATAGVSLGYSTLAGSIGYQYEQGDQLAIIKSPLVQGVFQNVIDSRVIFSGSVLLSVNYATTAVTLAPLHSETTTRLHSPVTRINPGQSVTITASVRTRTAPVPIGTVRFLRGNSVLQSVAIGPNGTASFSTKALPLGTSTITAVYVGDGGFLSSASTPLDIVVVPFVTVTKMSGSPNPSTLGQSVTLTATVTAGSEPVTAGTVTFWRGLRRLGTSHLSSTGTASLSVSSLPVGTIRVQAIYSGAGDDASSISSVYKQKVDPRQGQKHFGKRTSSTVRRPT
jgi:hypothetical protein